MSSKLSQSDLSLKIISCQFLENLSLKRVADVQQCANNIIAVMKADDSASLLACSILAKLATDEVRITHLIHNVFHCFTLLFAWGGRFSLERQRMSNGCYVPLTHVVIVRSGTVIQTYIHAVVASRIDYCNSILYRVAAVHLRPLQSV